MRRFALPDVPKTYWLLLNGFKSVRLRTVMDAKSFLSGRLILDLSRGTAAVNLRPKNVLDSKYGAIIDVVKSAESCTALENTILQILSLYNPTMLFNLTLSSTFITPLKARKHLPSASLLYAILLSSMSDTWKQATLQRWATDRMNFTGSRHVPRYQVDIC